MALSEVSGSKRKKRPADGAPAKLCWVARSR
jgi:hypothetical protein